MAATPAPSRWVIPATASTAAAAALAGVIAIRDADIAGPLAIPGVIAVLLLAAAVLMRWTNGIAVAVVLIGLEYAVATVQRGGGVDAAAPLVGAGLLVVAELGHVACERGEPHALIRGVETRRWMIVAAATAGGIALAVIALAVAQNTASFGFGELAAGALAVVTVVGLLTWLARDVRDRG